MSSPVVLQRMYNDQMYNGVTPKLHICKRGRRLPAPKTQLLAEMIYDSHQVDKESGCLQQQNTHTNLNIDVMYIYIYMYSLLFDTIMETRFDASFGFGQQHKQAIGNQIPIGWSITKLQVRRRSIRKQDEVTRSIISQEEVNEKSMRGQ